MTLQEMSLEQLKALAYDSIANRDTHQNNLNLINNEIAERTKEVKPEVALDTEVVEPEE